MDEKWQIHGKSMTSLHTFTHTLKGTVHTFTLNIYNNLTKLRGTQGKISLKDPKIHKIDKTCKSSVASVL